MSLSDQSNLVVVVIAAIALLSASQSAGAAELNWEIGTDMRYTDNIDLVPDNGEDEFTIVPRAGLTFSTESKFVEMDLNALVEYYEYTKDTYSNDTNFYADLVMNIHLVPEFFDWHIENSLSNEAVDVQDTETPDNRQNVNVFFTGPEFMFRLGQANKLDILGGYIRTDAEETPEFDSDRWVGKASFMRSVSPYTDAGIKAEYEDAEFDIPEISDGMSNDYTRKDIFFSSLWTRGSNTLLLDAGYTDLDFLERRDDDGERLRLVYTRTTGDAAAIELTFENLFTDASRTIVGEPSYGLGGIDVSADVYRQKMAKFSYFGNMYGFELQYSADIRDEEYVQFNDQDRDVIETELGFVRPLSYRLSWTGLARWGDYDYKNQLLFLENRETVDDKETYIISGFLFRLRPNLVFNAEAGWHDIDSNLPANNGEEWLAQIGVSYRN